MTAQSKWNKIVEHHSKFYNVKEEKVQTVWESIFAELLNYSRLDDEIDRHRKIKIGASERIITDIIIKDDVDDWFIVELKQHNYPLNAEIETQLFSYLNQLKLDLGIIVCNKLYIYDYDYNKNDAEQDKIEISFSLDNPLGIMFVELFSKSNFIKTAVKEFISLSISVESIKRELNQNLVKSLLNNHFTKKYSQSAVEQALGNVGIHITHNSFKPDCSSDLVSQPINQTPINQGNVLDKFEENALLIKIQQKRIDECNGDIYEATRFAWVLSLERAKTVDYVISARTGDGVVIGMFSDLKWSMTSDGGRVEFTGVEAPSNIKDKYIGKIIPPEYRKSGMAGPCLYTNNVNNVLAGRTSKGNPTVDEVEKYLRDKIEQARQAGEKSINIKCGDIQKEIKGDNMPAPICSAMNKIGKDIPHEVLYSPPSGKSTAYEIEYFLN